MSQPNNEPQQEQEVNLLPVFVWISNGFKNLFKSIGVTLKSIAHFIVLFFIFIKKNWIIVLSTTIIGIAIGWYLKVENKNIYTASAIVKPNFKSTAQLIANVNYYNSLVEQKNTSMLAQELQLNQQQVASIESLNIQPEFNETELLEEYDRLARKSDSVALENFTFKGFMAAKRPVDYEYHSIKVNGTDNTTLEKVIEKVIHIEENSMIKAQKQALKETADFDLKIMQQQLTELDSLIMAYKTAITNTSSSTSVTTQFIIGDQAASESLKDLFDRKQFLLSKIAQTREDKYSFNHTVQMVSQYIKKGFIEKKHYRLKGALIGLGIGLLLALIPVFVRFLNHYEKQHA